MKRILTVLVVGVLGAAIFVACGGDKKPASDPSAAGGDSAMPSAGPDMSASAAPAAS